MTRITIWRSDEDGIIGFTSEGHSGYGVAGKDIVCAGFSALLQTAILGLKEYLNLELKLKIMPEPAFMECIVKDFLDKKSEAQAVLETMLLGLWEIAKQYPEFIQLSEKLYKGGAD